MKINNISVKLINDECIEELIKNNVKNNVKNNKNDVLSDELDEQTIKKIEHLESKREGLKEITIEKLKDELYNGKILCCT